jgi:hypothetical protein
MRSVVSSATIYIQEELSDARLHCEELKSYVARAIGMIQESGKRDHFFAVAGDILSGAPDALMKLEKSLQATALAVNKLDYEEIRQVLRPEKVDALERILEDVRLKIPRRTGEKILQVSGSDDEVYDYDR